MKRFLFCVIMAVIALTGVLVTASISYAKEARTSVLVLHKDDFVQKIDPALYEELKDAVAVKTLGYEKLNWDTLKQFDVVVLQYFYVVDDLKNRGEIMQMLHKYVEAGGGLLLLNDTKDQRYNAFINNFLADFGAKILLQPLQDSDTANTIRQGGYLHVVYSTTSNFAAHPVTEGLAELLLPIGGGLYSYTYPAATSSDWNVLVKGSATAYAGPADEPVYPKAPPIVVSRDFGKGRILIIPSDSHIFFQSPFHNAWEGIPTEQSDTVKLVRNALVWLGEPSRKGDIFGGYDDEGKGAQRDLSDTVCVYRKLEKERWPNPKNIYRGFIGAQTTRSGYDYSVQDFCDAARQSGYDFLVFTEDLTGTEGVSLDELEAFQKECEENACERLRTFPGYIFNDVNFNKKGIAFNFAPAEYLKKIDAKPVLPSITSIAFGDSWPFVALTDVHNDIYDGVKFFFGLDVFSYRNNELTNSAEAQYRFLQSATYDLHPIATDVIQDPSDIFNFDGYTFYTYADSLDDLYRVLDYLPDVTGPFASKRGSFVSNGPMIDEFWIEGDGWTKDYWEVYYLWNPGDEYKIHIKASSEKPITDVIIYSNGIDEERHYRPDATTFEIVIDEVASRDKYYMVEVIDSAGKRAISNVLTLRNFWRWTRMCTDQQNIIDNTWIADAMGDVLYLDKPYYCVAIMYNYAGSTTKAKITPTFPTGKLYPEGFDSPPVGWMNIDYAPHFKSIEPVESQPPRQNIPLVNEFCSKYRNRVTTDYYDASIDMASWTPQPYGNIEILYDVHISFTKDLAISKTDKPELQLFNVSASGAFNYYMYTSNVETDLVTGILPEDNNVVMGTIAPYGMVAVYPDTYGNYGLVNLDGKAYTLKIRPDGFAVGVESSESAYKAGDELSFRFAFIRDSGKYPDATYFTKLDTFTKTASGYDLEVTGGTESNRVYCLDLEADAWAATGEFQGFDPNYEFPLHVIAHGLNDNWTTALMTQKLRDDTQSSALAGEITFVNSVDGNAYVNVNSPMTQKIVIGNILTADNENIVLNVLKIDDGALTVEVHNPTDADVTVNVKTNPQFPILQKSAAVTVPRGSSITIELR